MGVDFEEDGESEEAASARGSKQGGGGGDDDGQEGEKEHGDWEGDGGDNDDGGGGEDGDDDAIKPRKEIDLGTKCLTVEQVLEECSSCGYPARLTAEKGVSLGDAKGGVNLVRVVMDEREAAGVADSMLSRAAFLQRLRYNKRLKILGRDLKDKEKEAYLMRRDGMDEEDPRLLKVDKAIQDLSVEIAGVQYDLDNGRPPVELLVANAQGLPPAKAEYDGHPLWDPRCIKVGGYVEGLMPSDEATFVARAALSGDVAAVKTVGVSSELEELYKGRINLPSIIKADLESGRSHLAKMEEDPDPPGGQEAVDQLRSKLDGMLVDLDAAMADAEAARDEWERAKATVSPEGGYSMRAAKYAEASIERAASEGGASDVAGGGGGGGGGGAGRGGSRPGTADAEWEEERKFKEEERKRKEEDRRRRGVLKEGVESDGMRHVATWIEERRMIDEQDAKEHPQAQPPEGRVNMVNSNHIMWVPLLLAGAGFDGEGGVEGVEHLVSMGALYLTAEMQAKAVKAANDLVELRKQHAKTEALKSDAAREVGECLERIAEREQEVVMTRKQLQNLPPNLHKQRARLSQDLAALQRLLRNARTAKSEKDLELEESTKLEEQQREEIPRLQQLVDALTGSLGDHARNTALHWSCIWDAHEVVGLLLKKGALPQARDIDGNTALHVAVGHGNVRCVEAFIENAPKDAVKEALATVNMRGQRPLDLAYDPLCRRALTRAVQGCGCAYRSEGTSIGYDENGKLVDESQETIGELPFEAQMHGGESGYTQVKLPFSGPPFSVASTGHTPESFMSAVDISGNGDLSATEIEIALKDYGLGRENPATKAFLESLDENKQYFIKELREELWPKILHLLFLKSLG